MSQISLRFLFTFLGFHDIRPLSKLLFFCFEQIDPTTRLIWIRYDLSLEPDLAAFTFKGSVKMTLDTTADLMDCKEVTVHAKELCFVSAKLNTTDGDVIDCVEVRNLFSSCGYIVTMNCRLTVVHRCQPIFFVIVPSSVVPSEPQKHHVYHGL
jgi:hypothetical protein